MDYKHTFALYDPMLSESMTNLGVHDELKITDEKIVHRIVRVLRLTVGNELILFDRRVHIQTTIVAQQKRSLCVEVRSYAENQKLQPELTILLPLLKMDHLEQAVYSLAELGASSIQLLTTEKTQLKWHEKEMTRLCKIVIAAAEQSKHFSFPEIVAPIPFSELGKKSYSCSIFFDPSGSDPSGTIEVLRKAVPATIALMVGPAGDLTSQEKEMLKVHNFTFLHLTPTVLQSHHAISLGCGIFRVFLS